MLRQTSLLFATGGFLLGLLSSAPVAAQAGFSGHWTLDRERSDPLIRGGGPLPEVEMTLEMRGDDVVVSRLYRRDGQEQPVSFTYVTDGKPHDVSTPFGGARTTRARWKKDRLVASYTISRDTQRGSFDLDITETWRLSEDGAEIEIAYLTRMGERSVPRTEIYVRTPAGE